MSSPRGHAAWRSGHRRRCAVASGMLVILGAGTLLAVLAVSRVRPATRPGELVSAPPRHSAQRQRAMMQALYFAPDDLRFYNEEVAQERPLQSEDAIVNSTCGLVAPRCRDLPSHVDRLSCALKLVCGMHVEKDSCQAEDGSACKDLLNLTSTRRPCFWAETLSGFQERGSASCRYRPGWGSGGSQAQRAQNVTGVESIMDAAAAVTAQRSHAEADDAIVQSVLGDLESELKTGHHDAADDEKYIGVLATRNNGKLPVYDPATHRLDLAHHYNQTVLSRANSRADYQAWRDHYYRYTCANGDCHYQRKPGMWEYHKYDHTHAFCHAPKCQVPPSETEGAEPDGSGRFSLREVGYDCFTGARGKGRGRYHPRRPAPMMCPRAGKGVIYDGSYIRRGYFPGAPFFDGANHKSPFIDEETDEEEPAVKPFGATHILWYPNAQDCGGGGDAYDYGCWEPKADGFQLTAWDDEQDKGQGNVQLEWCSWGAAMVPCVPGFGGSYYEPGMRGNDAGIWEGHAEGGVIPGVKPPGHVKAGRLSDPYYFNYAQARDSGW